MNGTGMKWEFERWLMCNVQQWLSHFCPKSYNTAIKLCVQLNIVVYGCGQTGNNTTFKLETAAHFLKLHFTPYT